MAADTPVPTGWACPCCGHVWAPWVACCAACGPGGERDREITEN